MGTFLGVFWKRGLDERREARKRVEEWREESRQQHEEKLAAVDKDTAIQRQKVERLDDSRESRQALADMLNED